MNLRWMVALVALLTATAAAAQDMPPGKWWQRTEIVRELSLSGEQRERLDGIFRETAPGLIDLRTDVEKRALELRALLDQPRLDRDAIQSAAAAVTEARGRLFERELMMLVSMRGVLTEQQWNAFRNRIEDRAAQSPRGRMMPPGGVRPGPGRGRGGMGGGGPRRP